MKQQHLLLEWHAAALCALLQRQAFIYVPAVALTVIHIILFAKVLMFDYCSWRLRMYNRGSTHCNAHGTVYKSKEVHKNKVI
jgi:hypothetical protein